MNSLRTIRYQREEFHGEPEACEGSLLTFVYDIPYVDACGVFPPLHILNELFSHGSAGGGMSPGAEWEPFTISEAEYAALVEAVKGTPVDQIRPYARYAFVPFKFDASLDHLQTRMEWFKAACQKYLRQRHAELKEAGFLQEI